MGKTRRARLALIAVNQQGDARIVLLSGKCQKSLECLSLEERYRRIDDVQTQVVLQMHDKVLGMARSEVALITDRLLMARGIARVNYCQLLGTRPAIFHCPNEERIVDAKHSFLFLNYDPPA